MVGGGKVDMDVLLEALAAMMTYYAVDRRQSQTFVSLSAL